ncbi:MAG TPA: glycosyltransferase [Acidimicrobiales bacterium]|nr:glycosyltransferase [Acidimicrobiales bacterium]
MGGIRLLSVVMPAHDEESCLAPAVREVADGLRSRGVEFELLVVENGSTDHTVAIADELAADIPEVRTFSLAEADYGLALKRGFRAASGDLVAIFDVDYYDLEFLDGALTAIDRADGADGADAPAIVVASKRGAGSVDSRALSRQIVTSGFSLILRAGFGLQVTDTHGMKLLRRAPLADLAESCRFGTDLFDTELIIRAQRAGMKVVEIPVNVRETRPSRSSIARRIPRTVAGLFRLRLALWQERFGAP